MPRARASRATSCRRPPAGPTCGAAARCGLLPEGQVLGVPTDLDELAGSGILSDDGLARVGRGRRPLVGAGRRRHDRRAHARPARRRGRRAARRPAGRRHQRRRHRPAQPGRHRPAARRRRPQRRRDPRRGLPGPARRGRRSRGARCSSRPAAGMGALVDALVARPRRAAASRSSPAPPSTLERTGRAWHVTVDLGTTSGDVQGSARSLLGADGVVVATPAAGGRRAPARRRAAGGHPARRDPLRLRGPGQPRGAARRDRPGARRQRLPRAARRGPHHHRLLVDVVEVAAPRAATARCGCARRSAATATTPRWPSTTTRSSPRCSPTCATRWRCAASRPRCG